LGTETQARSAGYPLMRYGLAEYNAVIDYQPKTESAKSVPETYRFIASNIKGCYVSWSRSLPSGEIKVGNKIYLSIPNGWDERLVYYPWYTGHRYWQYNQWNYPEQNYSNSSITPKGARGNEGHYNYYHGNETNLSVYRNRNRFTDKLLVWYKEAERKVASIDDLSPTLENPTKPTKNTTIIRMKVFVQNSNETVNFYIKPLSDCITYMYDFGDGSNDIYTQEDYNTVISHKYSSPGYYVIDVDIVSGINSAVHVRLLDRVIVNSDFSSSSVLKTLYVNCSGEFETTEVSFNCGGILEYVYISAVQDHYSINFWNGTHIDNLYIVPKDTEEDQFQGNVVLSSGYGNYYNMVSNLYLSSKVKQLDISYFNYFNTGTVNVYSYSLDPLRVICYPVYDSVNDIYDFSLLAFDMLLFIRASIITEVQELNYNLPVSVF